ncbi:hypothetical protein Tco_1487532, partial [Tanacetum coccineum]
SGRNMDGVRTEESRQNDNEEKRKEENLSKSSNDGNADSEGFILVQKRENGDVVGKVLNPNYKPNTQNPRFVNQKNNMNGKANVQYKFQPKKKVNNGNKELVKPAETTMNNSSGVLETHIKAKGLNKTSDRIFGTWEWYSNLNFYDKGYRIMVGIKRRGLWKDLQMKKRIVRDRAWIMMGDINVTMVPNEHFTGGSGKDKKDKKKQKQSKTDKKRKRQEKE